jgi:hypothetical protein
MECENRMLYRTIDFLLFACKRHVDHSLENKVINEQINKQNIDNSECFGSKYVKIYPEMTSQYFFEKIWFWLII